MRNNDRPHATLRPRDPWPPPRAPSGGTDLTNSPHIRPLLLSHRGNSFQRILILLKYFCMISSVKYTLLCSCAFLTTHVDGWTETQKHKAHTAQPLGVCFPQLSIGPRSQSFSGNTCPNSQAPLSFRASNAQPETLPFWEG